MRDMFKNWAVGNDGNYYYVGDMSIEEVKEENEIEDPDFSFIAPENWTAENYAEILSCELENANYHGWMELPQRILGVLTESNLSEEKMKYIMVGIVKSIYEMI